MKCESMESCAFFQKHKGIPGFTTREDINRYCLATEADLCRRKIHLKRFGTHPSDRMSPVGYDIRVG